MQSNGVDGFYLFPITAYITYVIRDNRILRYTTPKTYLSNLNYDVFVVQGDKPTHTRHETCVYVASTHLYHSACTVIERNIETAQRLGGIPQMEK